MKLANIVLKIEKGIELTSEEKEFLYKTPFYVKKICSELNKLQKPSAEEIVKKIRAGVKFENLTKEEQEYCKTFQPALAGLTSENLGIEAKPGTVIENEFFIDGKKLEEVLKRPRRK